MRPRSPAKLPATHRPNNSNVLRALGRIAESRRRKCAIEFAPTRTDLYPEALAAGPTSLGTRKAGPADVGRHAQSA